MLNTFDWIRLSSTGAELIATLLLQANQVDGEDFSLASPFPDLDASIGPPLSALSSPCHRCWVYPRVPWIEKADRYCSACKAILTHTRHYEKAAPRSAMIWGFVSKLPVDRVTTNLSAVLAFHARDDHHFLMVVGKRQLKPCLQELVLHHGADIKGLLQIFPGVGPSSGIRMGELISRADHHEARR